jgi:AraC-like DNA-binding protein
MTIAKPPIRKSLAGAGVHLWGPAYPKGTRLDPHMHREAQLVFAASGTMQVTTPQGRWLVPPGRAVWVPGRLEHAIDVLADIEMRTLYFNVPWLARKAPKRNLDSEFVVRVSPLLRETILSLFEDRRDRARTALLIQLALLELHRAEDAATFIPLPHEPRCRRAAEIVLRDPATAHDIEDLASSIGTSARTLSRLFAAETHISFKSWCQRARIAAAIERWATRPHLSVKQAAADMGYASFPAFCHAFRQVTGKTPTEFSEGR